MKKYYLENISDVFSAVESTPNGLGGAQASQRLARDGKNKLEEAKKKSLLRRFIEQLLNPMILVLIGAAVVSAVTASLSHEQEGYADVIIILVVVILNAVLGVYQESKAEKAIEALQKMAAATSKVLRDGEIVTVKSEEIAVGDVLLLEAGDAVPADCRLFECASMKIEESALTGESVPVSKLVDKLTPKGQDVALGDRKNMAYMGSTVAYGRGKAVVTATGMHTEMGKIASAITQAEDGETPLQKKLTQLSKILTWLVLGICVFIFAFGLLRGHDFHLQAILDTFLIAVSLAVAAIPEGLAAVVTIVLSIGVTNMSKRNAVIRKLTAVETLGCAQIICSDKTGTLTQNRMTVVEHFGADETLLATAMALCTDAEVKADGTVAGEPTEAALVSYGLSLSLNKNELKKASPRVGEAPFDSMRKMMSTLHQMAQGKIVQYTKGAPDVVLSRCTKIWEGGKEVALTQEKREEILRQNKAMADKALRVLAAAFRSYDSLPASTEPEALEKELVFIGLTGMIDPVRPEVKAAVAECREAGIRPIMITGDHLDTAVAIAKELGIVEDASQAITGAQLSEMDDETFERQVDRYSVYARVQPEHKVRIVSAWKKRGMVTAMTGDGVNDAPAIKTADIGIGMGITGTDVTKNVADMVLADDNFATIVSAVEEGRRIYDNIRKTIQFLLSSNLSEVLCILVATVGLGALTGGPFTILLPVHLLWINLITDSIPAIGLGMERGERDLMKRKPRNSSDGVFAGGLGPELLYQGVLIAAQTIFAYALGYNNVDDVTGLHNHAITMAFLTLSMCEVFHAFNMRSQHGSVLAMGLRGSHNWVLYGAMVLSVLLTTTVIYVPFLAEAFRLVPLTAVEYFEAMLLAFLIIPIVEIVKAFQRMYYKKKGRE